ncbi:helix-turn-helix domain-containing protein [Belliella sp. DSM 111904]|uniref:Helix-turn-helix domain-containing protein n=1 Tax=Belliella filtrata TaxID=2923435 RepID=A0ABS9V6F3_9BACT|nr:helix-turn-helix domain-containing protein [Belliella filtrata]MCH7411518.1 helix-turn-helix domain-containing protein [Belliella filtrata]
MAVEIITQEDLDKFRRELLEDIKRLLKIISGQPTKKWLKSFEVRKLLGISPGTLQNLRVNGTLPYTKVGGVLYYDQDDIQKMLQANKFQNRVFQDS